MVLEPLEVLQLSSLFDGTQRFSRQVLSNLTFTVITSGEINIVVDERYPLDATIYLLL